MSTCTSIYVYIYMYIFADIHAHAHVHMHMHVPELLEYPKLHTARVRASPGPRSQPLRACRAAPLGCPSVHISNTHLCVYIHKLSTNVYVCKLDVLLRFPLSSQSVCSYSLCLAWPKGLCFAYVNISVYVDTYMTNTTCFQAALSGLQLPRLHYHQCLLHNDLHK